MCAGLDSQQSVQQVVAFPGPEAEVPRIHLGAGVPAADGKHTRTMTGRQRQRAFKAPALEVRSEEHTSELQSRLHLVCRLLLEKKKKQLHQLRDPYDHLLT